MEHLPKILIILGPTASGKSNLAVELALKFNGEVVSADSRQVYKGLDIGSGKITTGEMKGIPHHLLDVHSPEEIFSVAEYKKLADEAIEDILKRGKLPIICGGTGFYIDAIAKNSTLPEVPPNQKLRRELGRKTLEELQMILKRIDPQRAGTVDMNNKVRIVRAIEVAQALGAVPKVKAIPKYESLYIGIDWPKEKLKERIHTRLLSRTENGMIEEVKNLHEAGLSWKRMFSLGLEYRYISLFLQDKMTREEMIEKIDTESWKYAKRQMTWFKRNKKINWLAPENLNDSENLVRSFL